MLRCIGLSSQRLLAGATLWAAALLLIAAAQSAHAATVELDASIGGSGQNCNATSSSGVIFFSLPVSGPVCIFGPVQVFRLDFIFDVPPNAADFLPCNSGPFFVGCGAFTPSPGVTDFFLSTPSQGIPANDFINLSFNGFTPFQEIEVVENTPEPPPAFSLALVVGILAIISSWRSKRAQCRGTRATPAI